MPIFDISNIGMRTLLHPAAGREDSAMPSEQMQADDARRLIERARLAGVPATLEITEDAVHAFAATAPGTSGSSGRLTISRVSARFLAR
jgi:hypothetical protein